MLHGSAGLKLNKPVLRKVMSEREFREYLIEKQKGSTHHKTLSHNFIPSMRLSADSKSCENNNEKLKDFTEASKGGGHNGRQSISNFKKLNSNEEQKKEEEEKTARSNSSVLYEKLAKHPSKLIGSNIEQSTEIANDLLLSYNKFYIERMHEGHVSHKEDDATLKKLLKKVLSDQDKMEIGKIIKVNDEQAQENYNENLYQPQIFNKSLYYTSPYASKANLVLNQMIMGKIETNNVNNQINKYLNKIDELNEMKKKLRFMPVVKISQAYRTLGMNGNPRKDSNAYNLSSSVGMLTKINNNDTISTTPIHTNQGLIASDSSRKLNSNNRKDPKKEQSQSLGAEEKKQAGKDKSLSNVKGVAGQSSNVKFGVVNYNMIEKKSRKDIFYQGMILQISTVKSSTIRPSARIRSNAIIFGHFLVLFGGLQNKRFNDVWICNLDLDGVFKRYKIRSEMLSYGEKLEPFDKLLDKSRKDKRSSNLYSIYGRGSVVGRKSLRLQNSLSSFQNITGIKKQDSSTAVNQQNSQPEEKEWDKNSSLITKAGEFYCKLDEILLEDEGLNIKRYKWRQVSTFESKVPDERSGHSMVTYEDKVYIYGGKSNSVTIEPLDLVCFNLRTLNFFLPEKVYNSREVKKRFDHVGVSIKGYLLIQGGTEVSILAKSKECILSDCYLYSFITGMWEKLVYRGETFTQVTGHCATVAISPDKLISKNYEFYNSFTDLSTKLYTNIKTEGIYFFGGKDEQGHCSSAVKVLKIFKKPAELINLEIRGRPPRPRYHATFDFYVKLNIIILFGGRNNEGQFFKDIYMLDLDTVCWISVAFTTEQQEFRLQRAGHLSIIYENSLLIFGGENEKLFEGTDFLSIDLDFENTVKYQSRSNPIAPIKSFFGKHK